MTTRERPVERNKIKNISIKIINTIYLVKAMITYEIIKLKNHSISSGFLI